MRIASRPSPPPKFDASRGRSSISKLPSDRSSRPLAELLLFALCGCGLGNAGTGSVEATFDKPECQIGNEESALEDFSFQADWMATERFNGILLIAIQKHRVNIEETDGLSIRFSIDSLMDLGLLTLDSERHQIVRPDATVPLRLMVSQDPGSPNAALSLFQTCPEFPTHPVLTGDLELTAITLQEDPDDTGRMEHITGTLTATLTRSNAEGRVGTVRAVFDFAPPRRPLTDFK